MGKNRRYGGTLQMSNITVCSAKRMEEQLGRLVLLRLCVLLSDYFMAGAKLRDATAGYDETTTHGIMGSYMICLWLGSGVY